MIYFTFLFLCIDCIFWNVKFILVTLAYFQRKCDQYWPHQGEISYGSITVKTIEEHRYANYVHRVFHICWNDWENGKAFGYFENDWKLVRQFHFTDWPDFGVPRERSTMLSFVQMVRRYMQEFESPTIVHCRSAVSFFQYVIMMKISEKYTS